MLQNIVEICSNLISVGLHMYFSKPVPTQVLCMDCPTSGTLLLLLLVNNGLAPKRRKSPTAFADRHSSVTRFRMVCEEQDAVPKVAKHSAIGKPAFCKSYVLFRRVKASGLPACTPFGYLPFYLREHPWVAFKEACERCWVQDCVIGSSRRKGVNCLLLKLRRPVQH